LPGLITQPPALDLCCSQGPQLRVPQHFTRFVVFDQAVEVFADRAGNVQAHQVLQAKHCGPRTPDQLTHDRVGFLNRVIVIQDVAQSGRAGDGTKSVADKVRRVLTNNHSFPQTTLAKLSDEPGDLRVGVRGGNYFQQLHVARRVEKVRPQKVRLELGRSLGGN